MRIYHNKLQGYLGQSLKPVWLVFGDEPWQKNDSLARIKAAAQQQGYAETVRFSVDDKFDWQLLLQEYQALSLFSSLRIFEIELTTTKIGDTGSKAILALLEHLHNDVILLFHGPKLESATSNKKWFKSLDQQGIYLPLYELDAKGLPMWIQQQARGLNLKLSREVTQLLIELFEGNLPALSQELEKLVILFGQQTITLEAAEQLLVKQAKFNPFQIIDAMLLGQCNKCITMLDQQQQQGVAAGQIIWFFHREINQLLMMTEALQQGENINVLFKQYRIWDKRKPLYQQALKNIPQANLKLACARVAQLDLLSKTSSDFNPFILLADICITLYHGQTMKNFSLDYENF
ncbi:DNA polymerase III subunit delta [Thalassomonas actiniarum]|uniref:DNA polymerase III subunit delta n=1 Tax=Thalassomonas actiniarum TaxID=485447 RepID=A0AAE9YT26_9GAMM|nr:DNA polymerase III subunit delta [Thalassomonas actiniarum]WDE00591.1 DNA polymerase III subunit delta [Thalassomonas actiniarum]